MFEFLRTYRRAVLTGGLLLLAFLVYAVNLRGKTEPNFLERGVLRLLAPFQRVTAAASSSLQRGSEDLLSLWGVRQENRQLRVLLQEQNSQLLAAGEALAANERLRRLLELKQTLPGRKVAATVIGEDSAPWFRTLVIDRGQRDGLDEGMPVVAAAGVVGQVVKVGETTARVLLVTDHASGVAGVVQRSRARGVVKGRGGGLCSMEFTAKEDDVRVGDQVLTSGIGGVFPKGLPLGEVTMVRKGEYGIFQNIEIRPTVNLQRLEEVLVLLPAPRP